MFDQYRYQVNKGIARPHGRLNYIFWDCCTSNPGNILTQDLNVTEK